MMKQWGKMHYLLTDAYRGNAFLNLVSEPFLQGTETYLAAHAGSSIDHFPADITTDELLIGFNIPNATHHALNKSGIGYIEFRLSPLQFGRDLYFAYRTNSDAVDMILRHYLVSPESLKLEASQLVASIRAHRRKLEKLNTYFSDLEKTTVIIAPDHQYPAHDIDINVLPPLTAFAEQLQQIDTNRRILYKPANDEDPTAMLAWLSALLKAPVKLCHQSSYQLLCFHDDIQLVGTSANILQEADWFSKDAVQLLPPLTPLDSTLEKGNAFKQLPFHVILSPEFWSAIAHHSPHALPVQPMLPEHLCAREIFDSWGDYEKVMTWCRTQPYLSFIRSGGGALGERVSALERKLHMDTATPATFESGVSTFSGHSAISALKNSCKGKTAYVLGNAASLNELDLAKLIKEEAFWCNRAFELEKCGIQFLPKYYMYADVLGFKNYGEKIMAVQAGTKFFRHDVYAYAEKEWAYELQQQHVIPFTSIADPGMHEGFFSMDAASRTYCGRTVVLDAIQIAAYMGYSRILVGGVDIDYSQPYFFGASINGRMPENDAIQAFEVAFQVLAQQGIELKKITSSPRLPLEYISSPLQRPAPPHT